MLWGGFIAVIVLGLWFITKTPTDNGKETLLLDKPSASDHVEGNAQAKVVLVEYSDLQCPACARYYPVVKQIREELGNDVMIVYRHFPLRQIHPHAEIAARAAEAAGMQGKFWEMHDIMFEFQQDWSAEINPKDSFERYAAQIGLDVGRFKDDINSKAAKEGVQNSYESGLRNGVNATPTFYLNGVKIENPNGYGLIDIVKAEIEKVKVESTGEENATQ